MSTKGSGRKPGRPSNAELAERKKKEEAEAKQRVNIVVPAIPMAAAYDPIESQNVVFKPNPGPQTEFLSATERQLLYGGAAGGKA